MSDLIKLYEESEKLRALQKRVLADEVIFKEGDTSSEMYILLKGKVEILKSNKRIAVVEEEGSYLGELSTLLGIPRTATLKTMASCTFLVVSADKVMDFFTSSPALGLKLARMLADRLARMNVGYVQLEEKIDKLAGRLKDSQERLSKREKQVEQLVARLEKLQKLNS
jgi:CRP-like cAMP-binding protein